MAVLRRQLLLMVLLFILLLVGLHFIRYAVLSDVQIPSFSQSALSSAISNSLISSGSPLKNFDIAKDVSVMPHWNVVWLTPVGLVSDNAVVVVESVGNSLNIELGPGNIFLPQSITKLPPSVQYYLYTQNLVQEGVN